MIRRLKLETFKNFRKAEFELGPLTLLVGTNASGKSNLRDAFRFIHGVSRGYTLAEIIGEKWIEGGVLQWKGIRGGTREAAYKGGRTFSIEATFDKDSDYYSYLLGVSIGGKGKPPRVVLERLRSDGMVYDSHPDDDPPAQGGQDSLFVRLPRDKQNRKHGKRLRFASNQPVLTQLVDHPECTPNARSYVQDAIAVLSSMRFLDLSPDAMRLPSLPGQDVLGDRGENLSSVLQAICEKADSKRAILEWIKELTPLDATDFDFVQDQTGRILVSLVEAGGQKISAYSASDGTLRFLAMIAALLGPKPAQFYFFEELENGIHPTRLHLLLQLIEQQVGGGKIQMVASSHSPQLLGFLSEKARENALLVYRLQNELEAHIRRILDIPEAARLLKEGDFARLHASGWLEDAVAFEGTEEAAK